MDALCLVIHTPSTRQNTSFYLSSIEFCEMCSCGGCGYRLGGVLFAEITLELLSLYRISDLFLVKVFERGWFVSFITRCCCQDAFGRKVKEQLVESRFRRRRTSYNCGKLVFSFSFVVCHVDYDFSQMGYSRRVVWSLGCLAISNYWLLDKNGRNHLCRSVPRSLVIWYILCGLCAVFPLVPVDRSENTFFMSVLFFHRSFVLL